PHGRLGPGSRRGAHARLPIRRRPRLGVARLRAHGRLRPARQGRRSLGQAGRPDPRRPPRRAHGPARDRRPPPRGGRQDRGGRAEDHLVLPVGGVLRRGAEGPLQADPPGHLLGGAACNKCRSTPSRSPRTSGRLGIEFPSLPKFLEMLRNLPMFEGRWNDHLVRHYTYDVEPGPGGGVRSKIARHAIEEEVANLQRTRLWVWHHQIQAPTLLFRAPDGLLRADDCLMTQEEAEAMARAIPNCRLVVVPNTNHYTVVLGDHPAVRRELADFLAA